MNMKKQSFRPRGRALAALLAAGLCVTALPANAFAEAGTSADTASFAESFKNAVTLDSGLWSRWWFGEGDLSYDAIYTDLKNLADEGIVRIEVAKSFVWTNSEKNMNAFYYVLKTADELGLKLDFATGNPYPAVTGTETLEVNGTVYYDPAAIGYDAEKCDVKSMNYAVLPVGEGLSDADTLTGVSSWVSQGFMGSALAEDQTISVNGENGEKIFAVTAAYIDADGKTILGAADLTEQADIVSYTEESGKKTAASVTVTPDALRALCGKEEQTAIDAAEGSWKIFTFYTAKQTNTVCYLSCYSTRTWSRWFEEGVIDNDAYWTEVLGLEAGEVRALFEKTGTGLWEDSLEAINISYTDYAYVDEDGLKAWVDLAELGENPERASGTGIYTASVTLPDSYDPETMGYILNFEEVTELFTVTVNGEKVIFNQTGSHGSSGDISACLVPGENTLEIKVAGGLFNAAKYYNTLASQTNADIIAQQSENPWTSRDGIIGDVTLTGYTRAA